MGKWKKFGLFAAVALVVIAADLLTKQWAFYNLASPDHPLPLHVPEDAAGETVEAFLGSSRFPDATVKDLVPLLPPLETTPDAQFPVSRITLDRGYYLFLEDSREEPPVFMLNPALKEFYDSRREGETDKDWKTSWKDREVNWAALLEEQFPYLSEEEVAHVLEARLVHPVPLQLPTIPAVAKVEKDDVFLLAQRKIDLIPGLFRFIYAENPGAAWGIMRDASLLMRIVFLQLASLLAMGLIFWVVWKAPDEHLLSAAALAMIMGGAIGNFVGRFDRFLVIDFMDMYIKDSHWPTYNVADIGITVGVALLFIQILRKKSPL